MIWTMAHNASSLTSVLLSYQKKLGSYDQQLWEKTIEERVLRGISSSIPKKVTRVKTELIDLDLIRGSVFSTAKPKHGRVRTTMRGIVRALCLPFCLKWWSEHTSPLVASFLLILYSLQVTSLSVFLVPRLVTSLLPPDSPHADFERELEDMPAAEVLFPVLMFIILSVIQSHVAASHSLRRRSRLNAAISAAASAPAPKSQSAATAAATVAPQVATSTCSSHRSSSHSSRKVVNKKKKRSPEKKSNARSMTVTQNSSNAETTDKENEVPNRDSGAGDKVPIAGSPMRQRESSRKPSDEESGLEMPDISSSNKNGSSCRRIRLQKDSNDPETRNRSPAHSRSCSRAQESRKPITRTSSGRTRGVEADQMTGEEGDRENEDIADLSSMDEISPYSTVNSESWRRYSDVLSQRIRTLSHHQSQQLHSQSQQRRFSGTDQEGVRSRANTFSSSKHCSRCSRFSPPKQPSSAKAGTISDIQMSVSSNESDEGSVSASPLDQRPGRVDVDCWPLVHSDATTEDDEDEVTGHVPASPVPPVTELIDGSVSELYDMEHRSCDGRTERVSCIIWSQFQCQKVDLSVVDISSAVIRKAEKSRQASYEFLYLAVLFSAIISLVPGVFRLQHMTDAPDVGRVVDKNEDCLMPALLNSSLVAQETSCPPVDMMDGVWSLLPVPDMKQLFNSLTAYDRSLITQFVVMTAMIERFFVSLFFFFLLCVAEQTYRERFLFAKYFSRLTSARRALGSELPHFRLNKVRNIKVWLSVRSLLRRHGPQRSVDVITSSCFVLSVVMLTFLCVQLLRSDSWSEEEHVWELVVWDLSLGAFMLRLMLLGIKRGRKFRSNLSVLMTEQINLYLQLQQKPHKKEELTLANHVLKLAADLLKQLEQTSSSSHFVSGFTPNHVLYNVTKVVVLSAFSAVLTELLGFKLKLHKIKL